MVSSGRQASTWTSVHGPMLEPAGVKMSPVGSGGAGHSVE